jgi:hypothetical protein
MLRQLGWDIETAQDVGLTGKIPDVKWVIHARKKHRISLTFDELKAKEGETVSRELRKRGGKIIRINGAGNEFRAIGKLLYHYQEWYPFLKDNNGVAVLSDIRPQGCKTYTPEEYHQHYHRRDAKLFEKYLKKRKNRPYRRRKRRPPFIPSEQGRLT